MRVRLLISVLFATVLSANAAIGLDVSLTAPKDKASVAYREEVSGTVSDSNAEVWVIIHPTELAKYWVQSPASVRKSGDWKLVVYFGEAGNAHSGKKYEVMAIANPGAKLKEGQVLTSWPKGAARTDIAEVKRQ